MEDKKYPITICSDQLRDGLTLQDNVLVIHNDDTALLLRTPLNSIEPKVYEQSYVSKLESDIEALEIIRKAYEFLLNKYPQLKDNVEPKVYGEDEVIELMRWLPRYAQPVSNNRQWVMRTDTTKHVTAKELLTSYNNSKTK